MQTRTVQVKQLSDLATEREIHEFFSFSGEIEHIQIVREYGKPKTAFVTFKDPRALEIALLLSGATIVDQIVSISPVENYVANRETQEVGVVEYAINIAPEDAASNTEEEKPGGRIFAAERKLNDTGSAVKTSRVVPMEDTQEVEEVQEEVISDKTSENKEEETRDEILARHRKEISQLQKKEVEMKKQAARGSKAEQKAKKKQVEEEVSQLSAKLKEKQAKELSALGYNSGNGNEKSNIDNLVKAIAGVSVSSQPENTKVSKAKQRRDKRAQQEAEREQRIQAEQNDIISDRVVENEKLERKLKPLGLTVCEIKPDGHCLYRAVENQLAHLFGGKSPYTYQQLREMAAVYMRKHTSDFLPFCLSENLIEGDSDESIAQKFENYCKEVESTAIWGGQLELGALTHCLKKHIMIFSGSFPDVEMGKEYKSTDGIGSSGSSIMLSYHMHAFGLGEHYNSVVPIPI